MHQKPDPYHSRTSAKWEAVPRLDPVVAHGPGPLTTDEVWNYGHDGFLFVSELFSQPEVDDLLNEANSLAEHWPSSRSGLVKEADSDRIRSVFRIHQYSELYKKLFRDARILDRIKQLVGTDVYIHQSCVNYKRALHGRDFTWHSDFETWHVEDGMPRMRALSVSLFLTESHEFNGPLMLIPGSHETYVRCAGDTPENHFEQSLRHQSLGVPNRDALASLMQGSQIVAPKGPAGSVVFFDCNTMHGSSGNLSAADRVNLFAVYNSVENAIEDPFCNRRPRPEYLAERSIDVLK